MVRVVFRYPVVVQGIEVMPIIFPGDRQIRNIPYQIAAMDLIHRYGLVVTGFLIPEYEHIPQEAELLP